MDGVPNALRTSNDRLASSLRGKRRAYTLSQDGQRAQEATTKAQPLRHITACLNRTLAQAKKTSYMLIVTLKGLSTVTHASHEKMGVVTSLSSDVLPQSIRTRIQPFQRDKLHIKHAFVLPFLCTTYV